MTFSEYVWSCKNILLIAKYKLGIAKPSVDFDDGRCFCLCENMMECPEDCGICPFYNPEGI